MPKPKPPAAGRGTCKHPDCHRNVSARGLCGPHYRRERKGKDVSTPVRSYNSARACAVEGCAGRHEARGYCKTHYHAKRRNGEFPDLARKCTVEDCEKIVMSGGLCTLHHFRWRAGRPMDWVRPPIGSQRVHEKLRELWGPARGYSCIQCGRQAAHWAYDGTDPEQHLGWPNSSAKNKAWYSIYPEFYMPMCVRCHATRDGALTVAELLEYREWKYATRMTLADLAVPRDEDFSDG